MDNKDGIVALLIDFGANLTAVNIAGNTPLHTASSRNAKECVQWLLKRGSDRTKVNKTGQTPQQIAVMAGLTEIANVIQSFKDEDIGIVWIDLVHRYRASSSTLLCVCIRFQHDPFKCLRITINARFVQDQTASSVDSTSNAD